MYNKSLPPALTASAREARQAFYCTLCSKGYARIHDFEAHENSYDHQHKKRFQEMKAMQRASQRPAASDAAREAEASGLKPISLAAVGNGGKQKPGFKKAGFKSAFGGEKPVVVPGVAGKEEKIEKEVMEVVESSDEEMVDGEPVYDPARPTS